MLFNFVWWCILGVVSGCLARFLVPGRNPLGCFTTLALGVVGSVAGGALGAQLFPKRPSGFEPGGLALALLAGMLMIALYQWISRPTQPPKNGTAP